MKDADDVEELLKEARKIMTEYEEREQKHRDWLEKQKKEANKWIKVGVIGVDAGICWIGDPCYITTLPHSKDSQFEDLNTPKPHPKEFGECWGDFCENLYKKEDETSQPAAQFNYDLGHPGLGVVTHTGYGDGLYDVFIKKNEEGRVKEAKVVFIEDED